MEIKSNIDVIKDRIYDTRKIRINSSERYKIIGKYVQLINVYYSLFSLLMVIITYGKDSEKTAIYILGFSVLIFTISIITSSLDFKSMEIAFKNCYIKLSELEFELNHLNNLNKDFEENVIKIEKQYTEILNHCENHSRHDYNKYLCTSNTKKLSELSTMKKIKIRSCYYLYNFGCMIIVLASLILPWTFGYLFNIIEYICEF
ncbi:MAG: SLOG-associating effector domain family 5 [Anaerocolumna sp.]|jgi:hypothetical protein|nr:SLOG-associating effector domain family 5 [Anaerocolumna sp.]